MHILTIVREYVQADGNYGTVSRADVSSTEVIMYDISKCG